MYLKLRKVWDNRASYSWYASLNSSVLNPEDFKRLIRRERGYSFRSNRPWYSIVAFLGSTPINGNQSLLEREPNLYLPPLLPPSLPTPIQLNNRPKGGS